MTKVELGDAIINKIEGELQILIDRKIGKRSLKLIEDSFERITKFIDNNVDNYID